MAFGESWLVPAFVWYCAPALETPSTGPAFWPFPGNVDSARFAILSAEI